MGAAAALPASFSRVTQEEKPAQVGDGQRFSLFFDLPEDKSITMPDRGLVDLFLSAEHQFWQISGELNFPTTAPSLWSEYLAI